MVYVSNKKKAAAASSAAADSSRTITPSPRVSGRGRKGKVPSRFVEKEDNDDDEISRKRERKKANDAASKRKRELAKQQEEDGSVKRVKPTKPNGGRGVSEMQNYNVVNVAQTQVKSVPAVWGAVQPAFASVVAPPPMYLGVYGKEAGFEENARVAEEEVRTK